MVNKTVLAVLERSKRKRQDWFGSKDPEMTKLMKDRNKTGDNHFQRSIEQTKT